MDYELRNTEEIVGVWSRVFEALSVRHFNILYKDAGFSLQPTADLRLISRNFVLSYLISLGRNIPEQPTIQLLNNSDFDDSLVDLWTNTFHHLAKLGFANAVYEWGRQTYSNYDEHDNQIIRSQWDDLLMDWSSEPEHPGLLPLHLSEQATETLKTLIKQYSENNIRLRKLVKQAEKSQKSRYEQYAHEVLQVMSWLSNQVHFVSKVEMWNNIFELLSDEEIDILQKWGWQQFDKIGIDSQPPLVRFSL